MFGDTWINMEHQQLSTMCRELKKEKDQLRGSLLREQSINAELIRKCESNITASSEMHKKDKKYIEDLERELRNSTQEIGFLQDQINDNKTQGSKCISVAEPEFGRQKEIELENDVSHIERLESALLSIQLESQCELESMKFDMITLEQRCFEAERLFEQTVQEKTHVEVQLKEAQRNFTSLERENIELQERLAVSERGIKALFSKMESRLDTCLKGKSFPNIDPHWRFDHFSPTDFNENALFIEVSCLCVDNLISFFSKLDAITAWDGGMKGEIEKMTAQIRESECLISQLKEDLREEKLKAKDEAEDLTQEMAELRYQMTEMLEEEHKHRALIEETSLRRIKELEMENCKEKLKCSKAVKHLQEATELAKSRAVDIQKLKNNYSNRSFHDDSDNDESSVKIGRAHV